MTVLEELQDLEQVCYYKKHKIKILFVLYILFFFYIHLFIFYKINFKKLNLIIFIFIAYHVNGKESRKITLQNAKKGITHLCMQLQYVNFFYFL